MKPSRADRHLIEHASAGTRSERQEERPGGTSTLNASAAISCRQLLEFIADYLGNELTGEERAAFERHLHHCRSCRAYLASYRQTIMLSREALEGPVDDVPEELVLAILARV